MPQQYKIVIFFLLVFCSGEKKIFSQDKYWEPVGFVSDTDFLASKVSIKNIYPFKGRLFTFNNFRSSSTFQLGYWDGVDWELIKQSEFPGKANKYFPGNANLIKNNSTLGIYVEDVAGSSLENWSYISYDGINWEVICSSDKFTNPVWSSNGSIISLGNDSLFFNLITEDSLSIALQVNNQVEFTNFENRIGHKLKMVNETVYVLDGINRSLEVGIVKWNGSEWEMPGATNLPIHPKDIAWYEGELYVGGEDKEPTSTGASLLQKLVNGQWEDVSTPDFYLIRNIRHHKGDLIVQARPSYFSNNTDFWRYNKITGWTLLDAPINDNGKTFEIHKDELFFVANALQNPDGETFYNLMKLPLLNDLNFSPMAEADEFNITNNVEFKLDITANDTDVNNDYLLIDWISNAANGTASISYEDKLNYRANRTFVGTEILTYKVCDRGGLCDSTTITLNVTYANNKPTTQTDTIYTNTQFGVQNLNVLKNDSDPDDDEFEISSLTMPSKGFVSIAADNLSINYENQSTPWDTLSFEYTVCDIFDSCATESVVMIFDSTYVGLSENEAKQNLVKLYPNPVKNELTFVSESHNINGLQIFSLTGQVMFQFIPKGTNEINISVENLATGLYLAKIQDSSGQNSFLRFIKE